MRVLVNLLLPCLVLCGCGARTDAAVTDAPLPSALGPYGLVLDLDDLDFDCAAGTLSFRGSVWEEARLLDALDATHAQLIRLPDEAVVGEIDLPPIHLAGDTRWARVEVDAPLTDPGCSLCGTEVVVRMSFTSTLGEEYAFSVPLRLACR